MDKPCGCSTAEQCFANCCCNSPAELLAWAKARGVEPATLAALERRAGLAAATASCCAADSCAAAPSAAGAAAAIDVCDEYRSLATQPVAARPHAPEPSADDAAPAAVGTRMASFTAMLACQGVLEGFMAAATALPPPKQCSAAPTMPLVATLVISDDLGSSAVILGDPPPPRS